MSEGRSNAEIARALREIRMLMEFAGEQFFRFMAYERASDAVNNAPPVASLIASGELTSLPGIGKTIAGKIEEIAASGTCDFLEELRGRYPPTLMEVLGVPGIGIKTARMMFEQFGIGSLADLGAALDDGRLAAAPRLGKKSLENMRRGILASRGRQRRWPLGLAYPLAEELIAYLRAGSPTERLIAAGSLRRAEATVGDIDLVCTASDADAVIAAFVAFPRAAAVVAEGSTKGSIWLETGLQIDLRVLPAHLFGNLLQHFTGSREHNIQLRELAVRKGLRVSENGILNLENGTNVTCATEEEVYATVGLAYVAPELRQGIGEIDAARDGTLPGEIAVDALRGDLRVLAGDDANAEALVAAAAARGYAYLTLSGPASEMSARRERLHALGEGHGVRVLCAGEAAILGDGSLDAGEETLSGCDLAIAIPGDRAGTRDERTARLIRACETRHVAIVAHPTGRFVDGEGPDFEGADFDLDAVFAAAARTGTALGMSGDPARLDLPSAQARRAKEFGVKIALSSDAGDPAGLGRISYAAGQARRAWLGPADLLNAAPVGDLLTLVDRKRA